MNLDSNTIKNEHYENSKDEFLSCFKCKTKEDLFQCEYEGTKIFPRIKVIICNKCKDQFPWNSDLVKQIHMGDVT